MHFGKPGLIVDVDTLDFDTILTLPEHKHVWGLKLGNKIEEEGINGVVDFMPPQRRMFVDIKREDVFDRIERITKIYANLNWNGLLFNLDGSMPAATLENAVKYRGGIGLIITGPLSDWTDEYCLDEYGVDLVGLLERRVNKALATGVNGITCPGFLLPKLREMPGSEKLFVPATGIRSPGEPPGNHGNPVTPEYALNFGAYPVIGSEVTNKKDPAAALKAVADRCAQTTN